MSKAKSHKAQHFVPQCYLSAWTDPNTPLGHTPYVWRFQKNGGDGKRKAPENIFKETDLYTIPLPDGGRDLRIEKGLQQIEQGIRSLREEFLDKRKGIPTVRYAKLCAFICALEHRNPSFRDHHRQQWGKVLAVGKEMEEKLATKTSEELKRISQMSLPASGSRGTFSMSDVERLIEQPIQILLSHYMSAELPILSQMQMNILCAPEGSWFITSDDPVARWDPEAHKRPLLYQGHVLGSPTIEVTLPISPSMMILIHHSKPLRRGVKPVIYTEIPARIVRSLNQRTWAYANEFVVSRSSQFDDEWIFKETHRQHDL